MSIISRAKPDGLSRRRPRLSQAADLVNRCTRRGVDVDQLLWRLLADLKERFDLARTVPKEADRLSWELPRFLELAGRKGGVIIVIDGLHRVQSKNGDHLHGSRCPDT